MAPRHGSLRGAFTLADAGKAFLEIGAGHVRGKLVVIP